MRYTKLIDSEIVFALNPIIISDRQIGNPPIFENKEKIKIKET